MAGVSIPRSARVALSTLLVAATLAEPVAQTPNPAGTLQKLDAGEAAVRGGNPKLALEIFAPLVPAVEPLNDVRVLARALIGLGWAQWANAQYGVSLETRRRALELVKPLNDPAREAYVLRGIGESLYALGRYDEALTQYSLGLDVAERSSNTREQGLLLSDIGSTHRNVGRLDEALAATQRSIALLRPLDEPRDLIQPLMVLGIVSRARGSYDRALEFYGEALAFARRVNDRRWESQLLGNSGNVYLDLGRYDRAIELYRQSLVIAEEIGYTTQVGFNHQNIGNVLNMAGRPVEARPHFEAALNIWRTSNRRAQVAATLVNVGVLHLRADRNFPAARETLEEALSIARDIQEGDLKGYALMNLGDTEYQERRYAAALARYDQAIAEMQTPINPEVEYQLLEGRGAALHRLGRLDEAVRALQASAAIVSDLRANVASDQSKIAFLDSRQEVFLELASSLVDAGRVDEALEAAEAVRARALADLMNDRELRARPQDRGPLDALRTAVANNASTQEVAGALAALRAQSAELASLIAAESPKAAELRALAARLNGATILEYLVTQESLLAFVVNADGIRVRRIDVGADALTARVRELARELAAWGQTQGQTPSPTPSLTLMLRDLHRLLVEPVAEWLPSIPDRPLVVVPHGPLMLLSFAPLTNDRGVPLVERHTISYAPALSVFRYTEAHRLRPGTLIGGGQQEPAGIPVRSALIVADPLPPADAGLDRLPGTLQEGRAVRQRLGDTEALLLSGATATEAAVKRSAGSRRVLHLATHGLVSQQRPLASSLLFAQGEGDDGYLRADEVFGLTLNADLVVLSGCSTGLGRLSGEGMLGLTRSFFFAGAASLVVSYWDVSDAATTELMDRFYAALAQGRDKASALRIAQIETRRRHPHPALWAAFVLQGEL